jgi:hypothetical protein
MRRYSRVYEIRIEIEDKSAETEGEDIELWVEDVLREGLPDSLEAHVLEFIEVDDEDL